MNNFRRTILNLLGAMALAFGLPAAAGEAAQPAPAAPAVQAAPAAQQLSTAEILPEGTIILTEIKPWAQWSKDFSQTAVARIFAEPEMREFLAGPLARISELIKRLRHAPAAAPVPPAPAPGAAPAAPPAAPAVPAAPEEKKTEEPGACACALDFLSDFTPGPYAVAVRYSAEDAVAKRAPAMAIIIGAKEDKNLDMLSSLLPPLLDNLKFKALTASFYKTPNGDTAQLLIATLAEKNLVLALHRNRLVLSNEILFCQQIMDGLSGALEKKLSASAPFKNCGLAGDEHLVAFLDVAGLKAALGAAENAGEVHTKLDSIFTLAGLSQTGAAAWSLKLNGPVFESRTAIFSKGERTGLLGALAEEGLSAEALKVCPQNTPFATGFRVRSDRVMPFLCDAIKTIHGQKALDDFIAAEAQWNKEAARDLEKEVRATFGNEFVVASLAGQENAGPLGTLSAFVVSLSVQDMQKAENLLDQVLTLVAAKQDPKGNAANVLKDLSFEGKKIRYMVTPRLLGLIEFSPAFVLQDNRLLMALDVPTVKRAMLLLKEGSALDSSPAFKAALESAGGNLGSMFNYVDWAAIYKAGFGLATNALKFAPADLLNQVGLDLNRAPTTEAVTRHLVPGLSIARVSSKGVVVSSRSPLPSLEVVMPPLAAITAVVASFRQTGAMLQKK